MKKQLFIISILILNTFADLRVAIGESGVGKSSLINWLNGKDIATVGHSYDSQTSTVGFYDIDLGLIRGVIDTPGFYDTTGLTNEQIAKLIQGELIKKGETNIKFYLVFDADSKRLKEKNFIADIKTYFGDACLDSTLILVNKIKQINATELESLNSYLLTKLKRFGFDSSRIVYLDIMENRDKYLNTLLEKDFNLPTCTIESIQTYYDKIERYFREELANESNYIYQEVKIPYTVQVTKTRTDFIDVPYISQENCHRRCEDRFFGICVSRETYCDTVHRIRKDQKVVNWVEEEVHYRTERNSKLKNEENYYREIAVQRVVQEIKNEVFVKKIK